MPQTTKNRRPSLSVRKTANERNKQKGSRCTDGNRENTAAPRIIANSIFALTLKPKTSIEISRKIKGNGFSSDDDYEKMYVDILACIQNAIKLVTGDRTKFNPLLNGFDLSQSFDFILNMFKTNVLPEGFDFNIEKDDDGEYFIVIYKECSFQAFWHALEIKPVVKKLYKTNLPLHNLFIRFIKSFSAKTNIDVWYNGGLGFVDDSYMLEQVENFEYDSEEEYQKELQEVLATVENYSKGEAHQYEQKLRIQKALPIPELRKQLSAFYSRNKLVKWMKDTLVFMEDNATATDFVYPQMQMDNDMGVMFDQQMCILWDISDRMTKEQEMYLDSEAQGIGICEPIIHALITKNSRTLNIAEIIESANWPKKLTKVYNQYYEATKL